MCKLITAKELKEQMKISDSTLYRWRKEGMPYQQFGYKTIRYDVEKVKEWAFFKFTNSLR